MRSNALPKPELGGRRFRLGLLRLLAVEQQPDARRVNRVAHDVRKTFDELRHAEAHRHVEHFFRELDRAFHLGAAAREHDAGGHELLESRAAQLLANELEQLFVTRLDDLGQRLPREPPRRPVADARHLDRLVGIRELRQRAGVLDLDLLGVRQRRAQRHRDVVRDLIAGDRNHGRVLDRAAAEDRDVGRAAAHVDEAHAELLLVLGQHRVSSTRAARARRPRP